MKKQNAVIVGVTFLLLFLNALSVLLFKKYAALSECSLIPLAFMVLAILNGALSCLLKHKGNFLMLGKHFGAFFDDDADYTFTEEYEARFRLMLFIYSAFIPFYIPIIFFAKSVLQALPSLAVFFLPQLIFVLMGIADTAREFKAQRHKEETERREREEQERREELGAWK